MPNDDPWCQTSHRPGKTSPGLADPGGGRDPDDPSSYMPAGRPFRRDLSVPFPGRIHPGSPGARDRSPSGEHPGIGVSSLKIATQSHRTLNHHVLVAAPAPDHNAERSTAGSQPLPLFPRWSCWINTAFCQMAGILRGRAVQILNRVWR